MNNIASLNLEDIKSPTVRRAYLRGMLRNGYDHGRAGLPGRWHYQSDRSRPEVRRAFILAIAYSRGWWRGAQAREKQNQTAAPETFSK